MTVGGVIYVTVETNYCGWCGFPIVEGEPHGVIEQTAEEIVVRCAPKLHVQHPRCIGRIDGVTK